MKTLFTFIFVLSFSCLFAQSVSIDQNFASNGIFTYTESDDVEFKDFEVLSDGRVLLLGNTSFDPDEGGNSRIVLIMLTQNGQQDINFGKKYIDTPQFSDYGHALTVLENGKILIAGYTSSATTFQGSLFMVTQNGNLDTSFGNDGRAFIPNEFTEFRNLEVQPSDSKIVVSGNGLLSSRYAYLVARFNANGTLDNTFNSKGFNMFRTSTSNAEEDDNAGWGLDIQTDGKIITCGTDENENGKVVRLNNDGKLDTTFGINGIRSTDHLDPDNGNGVGYYFFSIQEVDDKIVLAGNRYTNNLGVKRYQACMYRLLTNGNADKTISEIGMKAYGVKYEYAYSNNLIIQGNGQYLLGFNNTFCRINAKDGSLDQGFDSEDGIYIHSDYSYNFLGLRLKGNHIYTVGHRLSSSIYSGIAIRFLNSTTSNINESSPQNLISLFPSLTSENVLINSTDPISKIQILSLEGYPIYEVNTNQILSQMIDVSNFISGHYFVIIISKNNTRIVRPFVKM